MAFVILSWAYVFKKTQLRIKYKLIYVLYFLHFHSSLQNEVIFFDTNLKDKLNF